jgi:2-dehydropantoate 2-reductase
MKILVMGAGTVGAYYGARLQQAGEKVVFCARGANLQKLAQSGLVITSIDGDLTLPKVTATDDPREHAFYDLILFCVKSYHTEDAARQIAECLHEGAAVLTLQNGVENETVLERILGPDTVMSGNARIFAEMPEPGRIVHTGMGYIEFGELDGTISQRARNYEAVFKRASILGRLVNNIRDLRWEKLMSNSAFNSITALTGRNLGDIYDDPDAYRLLRRMMAEAVEVARAEGATIPDERVEWLLDYVDRNLRDSNSSTLQDLRRGRRLEYDAITGAVLRAARRHGIATPATEAMHALLKLLDPAAVVE